MGLLGVHVLRDGNVIELANARLEVAEACNGLRYLFPLLSISFLLAMLLEDRFWKKAVLFVSAFPIAVIMNACRLAMIGLLVDRYGVGMTEGVQHEVEGFAVFALCIVLLLAEAHALSRAGQTGRLIAFGTLLPSRRSITALTHWPLTKPFLVACAILAAGATLVCALPDRVEKIPDRRPLALFPMVLGSWQGSPHPMDATMLGALSLTDYVMADYVDSGDEAGS